MTPGDPFRCRFHRRETLSGQRGVRLLFFACLPRRRDLGVDEPQVTDEQAAFNDSEPVFERLVLFRLLRLPPQRLDASADLALNIAHPQQICLSGFEFPQGFALLDPVLFYACRFFKQPAPVFGVDRQHGVDLSLG